MEAFFEKFLLEVGKGERDFTRGVGQRLQVASNDAQKCRYREGEGDKTNDGGCEVEGGEVRVAVRHNWLGIFMTEMNTGEERRRKRRWKCRKAACMMQRLYIEENNDLTVVRNTFTQLVTVLGCS